MPDQVTTAHRIGWIGVGNMGRPLVTRLLRAGCDVAVYNRTRAKAEPLAELGAKIVDLPIDLADREIVFSAVSGPDDFLSVMTGKHGVLSYEQKVPQLLVDCSTISAEASSTVRAAAEERGVVLLAAPISGNGNHVAAGGALFAVSGPEESFEIARPYLGILGRGAYYLGPEDNARLVKIAHNLFLGATIQSMIETTLLVQAAGISRRAYLDFLNDSALGSVFSGYKEPALVELDWSPTFPSTLLRKDLQLGLDAASKLGVDLPVTAVVRDLIQQTIDGGFADVDFAAMLVTQAQQAGIELQPEQLGTPQPSVAAAKV
jgi:3-hydroxyisobutyrate dehydrogenase-like beta-hydroxyacid dehydrogenase